MPIAMVWKNLVCPGTITGTLTSLMSPGHLPLVLTSPSSARLSLTEIEVNRRNRVRESGRGVSLVKPLEVHQGGSEPSKDRMTEA